MHVQSKLIAGLVTAFTVVLILFCVLVETGRADQAQPAALKAIESTFVFPDGTQLCIQASGTIDRDVGRGVLLLKTFKVTLAGHLVSPERFQKVMSEVIGVKLETLQAYQKTEGNLPEDVKVKYVVAFEYLGDAFGTLYPRSWEIRKTMKITFSKEGILETVVE